MISVKEIVYRQLYVNTTLQHFIALTISFIRYFKFCVMIIYLSIVSINLLVFYHQCCSLIGSATPYLFCCR